MSHLLSLTHFGCLFALLFIHLLSLCSSFSTHSLSFIQTEPFSDDYYSGNIEAEYIAQRQVCGSSSSANSNWYPISDNGLDQCKQVIDEQEVPPVYGGCKFDMPIGSCKDRDVVDETIGCASALEEIMMDSMNTPAVLVWVMSILQVLAIICSCCFCWKRKIDDTYPDEIKYVPYDPYKGKKNVNVASMLEKHIHRPKHLEEGIEFIED
jgi:hypothetical protein